MKTTLINASLLTVSLILSLVFSEFVLFVLHFRPAYSKTISSSHVDKEICATGSFDGLLAKGTIRSSLGNLKPDKDLGYTYYTEPHGFRDSKDFFRDYGNYKRVLVLGDSFTGGTGADSGKGYIELLNQYYERQGVLFFNTGVGGYGQNNQLAVLRKYYEVLRPNAVLLGFYTGNDFTDNLTPVDRYTRFRGGVDVSNYEVVIFNDNVRIRRRSQDEVLRIYKRSIGCNEISSTKGRLLKEFVREEMFYRTRIGTQIYYLMHKLRNSWERIARKSQGSVRKPVEEGQEFQTTEGYLLAIRRYLAERRTPFYVLLIPDVVESKEGLTKSKNYFRAVRLFEKHGIRYFDIFAKLNRGDYGLRKNDDHWNNAGHFKAYELVRNELAKELRNW